MITFCLNEAETRSSSTWVLSNHDIIRHATRYALPSGTDLDNWLMADGVLPLANEEQGLQQRSKATCSCLPCPDRRTSIKERSWDCTRWPTFRRRRCRDPIGTGR